MLPARKQIPRAKSRFGMTKLAGNFPQQIYIDKIFQAENEGAGGELPSAHSCDKRL